uniref:Uncharacterized protein n=1 Tax=Trypanosoma congolense (strain IL3000) TaxID=1068625 RepID=G0V2U1_TRYCI|nr:hypothetical protein, unlikely [Trypanosoma congolense IL3000]
MGKVNGGACTAMVSLRFTRGNEGGIIYDIASLRTYIVVKRDVFVLSNYLPSYFVPFPLHLFPSPLSLICVLFFSSSTFPFTLHCFTSPNRCVLGNLLLYHILFRQHTWITLLSRSDSERKKERNGRAAPGVKGARQVRLFKSI